MAWDFSTDPEWAEQLAWVEAFVRSECEPIDLIVKESHDLNDPVRQALIPPLQEIVKQRGLWATHLGAHLGGPGYRPDEAGAAERDPRPGPNARRSYSVRRHPIPATARSWPTTGRPSSKSATSSRCSTTGSCRASR